jgi:hypothetical protein
VKKTVRLMVVGPLLLSLWTVPASGQEPGALESLAKRAAEGDGLGKLLPLLLKGIGMTPEQNQRVAEIMASHRENFRCFSFSCNRPIRIWRTS